MASTRCPHLAARPAPIAVRTGIPATVAAPGRTLTLVESITDDVLSDVLGVIKLDSAIYFNAELGTPWAFDSPPSAKMAAVLAPGSHVIVYHLLVEGSATGRIEGAPPVDLAPGDIITFPHGDPHVIGSGRTSAAIDAGPVLTEVLERGLALYKEGGPGAPTRLICGYLACDPQLGQAFLGGLPSIVRVNIREDAAGRWLEEALRFSVNEVASGGAGARAMLTRLSEAVFAETVRRYVRSLPQAETGWLAGTRDPEVGRALTLIHQRPAEPWTIASLAHEVGLSRTVLAERFRHFLNEPPMSYLTKWRLRLAARTLAADASTSLTEVATDVGYESDAAFSRAFKREFGVPPAQYRREAARRLVTPAAS